MLAECARRALGIRPAENQITTGMTGEMLCLE
jgi:hypothetical protein